MSWVRSTIQLQEDALSSETLERQIGETIAPAVSALETDSFRPTTDFGIQTEPYDENFSLNSFNNTLNHSPAHSAREGDLYGQ